MNRITLAGLNADTSALGMGCASLGSRVGAAQGRAALEAAFEDGVTWFDLAPAYGAGQAEEIFAGFAEAKRDRLQICTKVGLLPPKQKLWKRAVMPLARRAVALAGPLRARIKKSGITRNRTVTLTPELVRNSLDQSLTRLKTDHVELYALHNAQPEDLRNEGLIRALEEILTSGKARAIAVASSHETAQAALDHVTPVRVLQYAHPDQPAGLTAQAAAAGFGTITHSVFGVSGALQQAQARLKAQPDLARAAQAAGLPDAAALLLARARAANPGGVVLCSMMSPRSRAANLAAAQQVIPPELAALCDENSL